MAKILVIEDSKAYKRRKVLEFSHELQFQSKTNEINNKIHQHERFILRTRWCVLSYLFFIGLFGCIKNFGKPDMVFYAVIFCFSGIVSYFFKKEEEKKHDNY